MVRLPFWYKWKKKKHIITWSDYHFHSVMLLHWGSTFKEVTSSFQVSFKTFEEIRIKKTCNQGFCFKLFAWFYVNVPNLVLWTTGRCAKWQLPQLACTACTLLILGIRSRGLACVSWGTRSDWDFLQRIANWKQNQQSILKQPWFFNRFFFNWFTGWRKAFFFSPFFNIFFTYQLEKGLSDKMRFEKARCSSLQTGLRVQTLLQAVSFYPLFLVSGSVSAQSPWNGTWNRFYVPQACWRTHIRTCTGAGGGMLLS